MFIGLVERDAETKLLAELAREATPTSNRGALYFAVGSKKLGIHVADLVPLLWPALEEKGAVLYLLSGGDVVVACNGLDHAVLDQVRKALYDLYGLTSKNGADKFYEYRAHADQLRARLQKKPPEPVAPAATVTPADEKPALELLFTEQQLQHMQRYAIERRTIMQPTILVVEDQEFSRKIMAGMLEGKFTCYYAATAEEAVALYGEHLPCVTFLDIELPDCDGHRLATFFRQHDPEGYIVMLTASRSAKDVRTACENRVNKFIVKPFSRQKILEAIDGYKRHRN